MIDRLDDVADASLPAAQTEFVHNAEHQLAVLLDFYGIEWQYEPHAFVLERNADGQITEAFRPDFYLPRHDRYLEVTTLRQSLVTRKNRKVRRLRELHPDIDISIIYQRDYRHMLVRYGLEPPEQDTELCRGTRAAETGSGLLDLGVIGPSHPSSPEFKRLASTSR